MRSLVFGPVRKTGPKEREQWLARARRQGWQLRHGRLDAAQRLGQKTGAWLTALRLQFYPMAWAGYLCLFLLEAATVLINELVDVQSDRSNRFFSLFTGGSRVRVNRRLSLREVKAGISVALLVWRRLLLRLKSGQPPGPGRWAHGRVAELPAVVWADPAVQPGRLKARAAR